MRIKPNASGFTLVEIMIVVAIIGLLAAVAVPNFVRARSKSQANICISNLRQLDGAAQTWALENRKNPNATYTLDEIKTYVKLDSRGELPACPANGTYSPGSTIATYPSCSIPDHHLP